MKVGNNRTMNKPHFSPTVMNFKAMKLTLLQLPNLIVVKFSQLFK